MLLRTATCAPAAGGGPALAWRTLVSGSAPSEARPPATRPERRRKARRSRPRSDCAAKAVSVVRSTRRSVLLISTGGPPSARIPVDPVIGFDFLCLPVPSLPLLVVTDAVRFSLDCKRSGRRAGEGADPQNAQQLATAWSLLALRAHRRSSHPCAHAARRRAKMLPFRSR